MARRLYRHEVRASTSNRWASSHQSPVISTYRYILFTEKKNNTTYHYYFFYRTTNSSWSYHNIVTKWNNNFGLKLKAPMMLRSLSSTAREVQSRSGHGCQIVLQKKNSFTLSLTGSILIISENLATMIIVGIGGTRDWPAEHGQFSCSSRHWFSLVTTYNY